MLYPPIDQLKNHINSKYLLVTTAAKRAREIQDHPRTELLDNYASYKPVGKALEEIAVGKINIIN